MSVPARLGTKAQAALSLRLAGASYDEIIETVGYRTVQDCRKDVNRLLAQDVPDDQRRHYRSLANQRFESLLDAIWDKAHNATHPEQLPAVRAAREILRELVQLHGSAAPQELLIHNPTTQELLRWMEERGMIGRPDVIEVDPYADAEDAEVVED